MHTSKMNHRSVDGVAKASYSSGSQTPHALPHPRPLSNSTSSSPASALRKDRFIAHRTSDVSSLSHFLLTTEDSVTPLQLSQPQSHTSLPAPTHLQSPLFHGGSLGRGGGGGSDGLLAQLVESHSSHPAFTGTTPYPTPSPSPARSLFGTPPAGGGGGGGRTSSLMGAGVTAAGRPRTTTPFFSPLLPDGRGGSRSGRYTGVGVESNGRSLSATLLTVLDSSNWFDSEVGTDAGLDEDGEEVQSGARAGTSFSLRWSGAGGGGPRGGDRRSTFIGGGRVTVESADRRSAEVVGPAAAHESRENQGEGISSEMLLAGGALPAAAMITPASAVSSLSRPSSQRFPPSPRSSDDVFLDVAAEHGSNSGYPTPRPVAQLHVEPYHARLARSLFHDAPQTSVLCHAPLQTEWGKGGSRSGGGTTTTTTGDGKKHPTHGSRSSMCSSVSSRMSSLPLPAGTRSTSRTTSLTPPPSCVVGGGGALRPLPSPPPFPPARQAVPPERREGQKEMLTLETNDAVPPSTLSIDDPLLFSRDPPPPLPFHHASSSSTTSLSFPTPIVPRLPLPRDGLERSESWRPFTTANGNALTHHHHQEEEEEHSPMVQPPVGGGITFTSALEDGYPEEDETTRRRQRRALPPASASRESVLPAAVVPGRGASRSRPFVSSCSVERPSHHHHHHLSHPYGEEKEEESRGSEVYTRSGESGSRLAWPHAGSAQRYPIESVPRSLLGSGSRSGSTCGDYHRVPRGYRRKLPLQSSTGEGFTNHFAFRPERVGNVEEEEEEVDSEMMADEGEMIMGMEEEAARRRQCVVLHGPPSSLSHSLQSWSARGEESGMAGEEGSDEHRGPQNRSSAALSPPSLLSSSARRGQRRNKGGEGWQYSCTRQRSTSFSDVDWKQSPLVRDGNGDGGGAYDTDRQEEGEQEEEEAAEQRKELDLLLRHPLLSSSRAWRRSIQSRSERKEWSRREASAEDQEEEEHARRTNVSLLSNPREGNGGCGRGHNGSCSSSCSSSSSSADEEVFHTSGPRFTGLSSSGAAAPLPPHLSTPPASLRLRQRRPLAALKNSGDGSAVHADPQSEMQYFNQRPAVVFKKNKENQFISRSFRYIPSSSAHVLDAMDVVDEFYYNVLDCSSLNIVAVALDDTTYLWNWRTKETTNLPKKNDHICAVRWAPEGELLAFSDEAGDVVIWDTKHSKELTTFASHRQRVCGLAWNLTGNFLTSGSADRSIILHDIRTSTPFLSLTNGHTGEICSLQWSLNDLYLASGADDDKLLIWDSRRLETPLHTFAQHTAAVKAISWHPSQPHLLVSGGGSEDAMLRFWSVDTGECVKKIATHSQISGVRWHPNGVELASSHGSPDNQVTLWRYPSLSCVTNLFGHSRRILSMCISAGGETLITVGSDEAIRFWACFPPTTPESGPPV